MPAFQQLKAGVFKLSQDNSWDWLDKLFGGWGLSGWLRSLVKTIVYALAVCVFLLLFLPCLLQCLQKWITQSVKKVLFVQQEGGDVGQGLRGKSPSTVQLISGDVLELVGHQPWEDGHKTLAGWLQTSGGQGM